MKHFEIFKFVISFLVVVISTQLLAMDEFEQRPLIYISLEGGGMHMSPALEVLAQLESRHQRPIAELVDGIIGLSSGAIIGAHLLAPNCKYLARELKSELPCMLKEGAKGSAMNGALTYFFGDKFFNFETLYKRNLGEVCMKDAHGHLLIAAYNRENNLTKIFDSHEESDANIGIWNLAQASGAISNSIGIELAWGATTIRCGDQLSPGWVDAGLEPEEQRRPLYESLARKLENSYPYRRIFIFSFGNGSTTFGGNIYKESPITILQVGNIVVSRFIPIYSDIPSSRWGINNYYQMMFDTSRENIDIIDSHFFNAELLDHAAYKNLFDVINKRITYQ